MWPSKRPSSVTIPWTAEDDGKSRDEKSFINNSLDVTLNSYFMNELSNVDQF